jgi:hypothetical protein
MPTCRESSGGAASGCTTTHGGCCAFGSRGLENETNEPRRDDQGRRLMIALGLKHLEPHLDAARALAQEIEDHESVIEIEQCLDAVQRTQKLMDLRHREVKASVEEELIDLRYLAMRLQMLGRYVEKNWGWPPVFD